jgi:hypothetical protein
MVPAERLHGTLPLLLPLGLQGVQELREGLQALRCKLLCCLGFNVRQGCEGVVIHPTGLQEA